MTTPDAIPACTRPIEVEVKEESVAVNEERQTMNDKRSTFFFDASCLEHKRANEKRELVYEFTGKRDDGALVFATAYSEKGRKTKLDDIMRELHKLDVEVKEEAVERAFRVFERQSEVDYFINKNARAFLREQFRPLDVPKSLTRHSKQASMYTNGRCTIPRSVTCPTLTNTRRERLLPPID